VFEHLSCISLITDVFVRSSKSHKSLFTHTFSYQSCLWYDKPIEAVPVMLTSDPRKEQEAVQELFHFII